MNHRSWRGPLEILATATAGFVDASLISWPFIIIKACTTVPLKLVSLFLSSPKLVIRALSHLSSDPSAFWSRCRPTWHIQRAEELFLDSST